MQNINELLQKKSNGDDLAPPTCPDYEFVDEDYMENLARLEKDKIINTIKNILENNNLEGIECELNYQNINIKIKKEKKSWKNMWGWFAPDLSYLTGFSLQGLILQSAGKYIIRVFI